MTQSPARPTAAEFAPYYERYIALVPDGDVIELLSNQLTELDSRIAPLSDEAALFRYAPDKWSIKEMLGHLGDTERIFGCRLLRISRGDETPIPGFDENTYVRAANFDRQPVAQLMDNLQVVRASTLSLAQSLDSDAWTRQGVANGVPASARAIIFITAGHVMHHMQILRERYNC